ncbi:MAG: glycosyltransferase family 2 protein [Dysgonamonadaceae bacterium]|jgi:GT2 family glycosyltransferase|nr:glycosyltransferase family 2 protein [Dysgonamonadaceae bacterium]
MKQVAVVILNWNGRELLERFLPALIARTEPESVELVVADNGSTDDSLAFLTQHYPSIRTIALDRNYGFAEGYNRALEKIENEYVVLLNSDVEVGHDWLRPAIDYLDNHREVAALQPKILSARDRSSFDYAGAAGGFIDRYGYPFCRGRIFDTVEKDGGQYDDITNVLWASGACLIIRTEIYKSLGGLDARFFAHQEEIDLCWRIRRTGAKIVCYPLSTVYHLGGATLNMNHPQKTFLNYRNNLLMLYKNLPRKDYSKVMIVRFFLDYLVALQGLLTGHPAHAAAIRKARRDFHRQKKQYGPERKEYTLPEEVFRKSIVYQYYLLSRKKYLQLFERIQK